jgi:outer membrane protein
MKNFSLVLNIVLLAAVAFLYIKLFSGNKMVGVSSATHIKDTSIHASALNGNAIGFVELDSLYEKISMIKSRRLDLEKEQKAIETEWRNGMTGLQGRANEFQKKGNAITQQEAEKFQGMLQQEQQQIEVKKQSQTQSLSEKSYKFMDDIQTKLKEFLADYNKDKKYKYILTTGTGMDYMLYKDPLLNVTNDVIKGMNIKLGEKK